MILASLIGIFAIPPLYVMFQAIREKLRPSSRPSEREPIEAAPMQSAKVKTPSSTDKGIAAE
jgi:hypothetical protein